MNTDQTNNDRLDVRLPQEIKQRLQKAAALDSRSVNSAVRLAIQKYIDFMERKQKGGNA